jgi:hypothetical protein
MSAHYLPSGRARRLTVGFDGDSICESFKLDAKSKDGIERWCYMDTDAVAVFTYNPTLRATVQTNIPMRWIKKACEILDSNEAKRRKRMAGK